MYDYLPFYVDEFIMLRLSHVSLAAAMCCLVCHGNTTSRLWLVDNECLRTYRDVTNIHYFVMGTFYWGVQHAYALGMPQQQLCVDAVLFLVSNS